MNHVVANTATGRSSSIARRPFVALLLVFASLSPAHALAIQGRVQYEKLVVSVSGLDVRRPIAVVAPRILVEARPASEPGKVLASVATDDGGAYRLEVPDGSGPVRLHCWARMGNITVIDPTSKETYSVRSEPFEPSNPPATFLIPDRNRQSGPFNILGAIHRANRFLERFDTTLRLADTRIVVNWSPTSTAIQSTYFRVGVNQAWVMGLRDEDSDEFDDHVLVHEYGHYIAARYSRDDSPGGLHWFGEKADPRLAWSEGWAHFFACAVLNSPLFVDTKGPGGREVLAFDLDQDIHDGDSPGFWSETSVASMLWDLYADVGTGSGHLGLGFEPVWKTLREHFPKHVWVSFLTFAEGLIQQDVSRQDGVTEVLARRGMEYRFGVVPPVPNPFPKPISPGATVTGSVDSYSTGRTNLLNSADYYLFKKETSGPVDLRLKVISSRWRNAADLVLVVYNAQRFMMAWEDKAHGVGSVEAWKINSLPPGTYIIGVESYVENARQSRPGAGTYELTAEF